MLVRYLMLAILALRLDLLLWSTLASIGMVRKGTSGSGKLMGTFRYMFLAFRSWMGLESPTKAWFTLEIP